MTPRIKFYRSNSGRSSVAAFVESLPDDVKSEFYDAMERLASGFYLPMPFSRSLAAIHKGLHELRIRGKEGNFRIFYYIKVPDGIFIVHGFKKKTQEIPRREIETVLYRIREINRALGNN